MAAATSSVAACIPVTVGGFVRSKSADELCSPKRAAGHAGGSCPSIPHASSHLKKWSLRPLAVRRHSPRNRSVLQQLLDPLVELFERDCAFDPLGIDEEGRRRSDLQHLMGELFIGG